MGRWLLVGGIFQASGYLLWRSLEKGLMEQTLNRMMALVSMKAIFLGILVKFHCKCTFFRIFKENPAWSVTSALQKLWMNTPHFSPRISPLTHLSSCIPVQHSWLYQCVFTSLLIKEFGIWYYNITKVLQKYLFQGIHTVIFFVKVFQMY